MDRDDLIKALGQAFDDPADEKTPEEPTSVVESAVAGERDVLRLITSYNSDHKMDVMIKYPEVYIVSKLVDELTQSGRSDIEIVGRELILKFNNAVEENNDAKIVEIIQGCKVIYTTLQNFPIGSQERALGYMMAVDKIKAF